VVAAIAANRDHERPDLAAEGLAIALRLQADPEFADSAD
jgi:hypothetical protein